MKNKQLHLLLPNHLYNLLNRIAEEKMISVSALIRQFCMNEVNRFLKEGILSEAVKQLSQAKEWPAPKYAVEDDGGETD